MIADNPAEVRFVQCRDTGGMRPKVARSLVGIAIVVAGVLCWKRASLVASFRLRSGVTTTRASISVSMQRM